jgi:ribosomal protein L11 methyltransferase
MVPHRWLEITVRLPGPIPILLSELVSQLLIDLGGRGVQELEDGLRTYLQPPAEPEALTEAALRRIRELPGADAAALDWRWQPQEDWEAFWRWGLGPRRITPRMVITPSWESVEPEPGLILVTLDPGMAFGTAEHPTTRGCLRLLDSRITPGARVADVGAGSGILSIVAACLGAGEVLALEMDELACGIAQENVAANGVDDRVRIIREEVSGGEPLPGAPLHGVVANLQTHLHLELLPAFRASLEGGGWLVLGGILRGEADGILDAAYRAGFSLEQEDQEEDWWSGAFRAEDSLP